MGMNSSTALKTRNDGANKMSPRSQEKKGKRTGVDASVQYSAKQFSYWPLWREREYLLEHIFQPVPCLFTTLI